MFAAGTSLWDSRRYEPRLMGLQGQSEIFFCEKGQNPKTTQRWSMQYVSRSGRPYPNIVHNVQSPALKQTIRPQEWLCHSRLRMVQSLQITGMKQNVLFLQRASMRKLIKGKHEKRCSFLERKGDRRSRWIVDSTFHHPPAKTGLSIVWKSKIS